MLTQIAILFSFLSREKIKILQIAKEKLSEEATASDSQKINEIQNDLDKINESTKFWATVLNGLRNRGVEDIFIACTDNLTGFDTAIHAVFPETEIQNCMIHQLRNFSKYVSYKDLKALIDQLEKAIVDYIDYYNNRRIKLKLNGLSPVQYRIQTVGAA